MEDGSGQPYFEFQVDKPVAPAGGCSPEYPAMLRAAGVEGTVLVQFVVGLDGRADPSTFKPLKTPHQLFTASIRRALACMRYTPAEVGGHRVRQLVQQPFQFGIEGR